MVVLAFVALGTLALEAVLAEESRVGYDFLASWCAGAFAASGPTLVTGL